MAKQTNKNQFKHIQDGIKGNMNGVKAAINMLPEEQQKKFSGILKGAQEAFAKKDVGELSKLMDKVKNLADGSQIS